MRNRPGTLQKLGQPWSLLDLVLCVCLASILLACSSDRHESFYPSLAEADRDGAITRGWMPDFMPVSSRDIHEVHEISPSKEWCAFEFLPTDSQGLRKNLQSVDALEPSVRRVSNPGVSWWPDVLMGNLDVERIHGAGFELYLVAAHDTPSTTELLLFAINWANGHGFFYSTRRVVQP
jgi:hypothetical protein